MPPTPPSGSSENKQTFAPVNLPMNRRLETFMVLFHSISIPIFSSLFLLLWAVPPLWPLLIAYLVYYAFDRSPANGNVYLRQKQWVRNLSCWKHFANYFPVTIHRTCELQPTFSDFGSGKTRTGPTYIFGYHPHGVVSMGVMCGVSTNGAGWDELFRGIRTSVLTLVNQFRVPLYREYLQALGISSVVRRNILRLLRYGQSCCIVVGGAQESLMAAPGKRDLLVKRRKGFVRIACEVGNVGLVPICAFGENELYETVETESTSPLRKLQLLLKNKLGFTIPIFHARGVFNYDFGMMPYRRPVHLVVGRPIYVPFLPSPTPEEVDRYHGMYIEELERVFEENKRKYYKIYDNTTKREIPSSEIDWDSIKLNFVE